MECVSVGLSTKGRHNGGIVDKLTEQDYEKLMNKARRHVLDILKNDGIIKKNKTQISIPIKTLEL